MASTASAARATRSLTSNALSSSALTRSRSSLCLRSSAFTATSVSRHSVSTTARKPAAQTSQWVRRAPANSEAASSTPPAKPAPKPASSPSSSGAAKPASTYQSRSSPSATRPPTYPSSQTSSATPQQYQAASQKAAEELELPITDLQSEGLNDSPIPIPDSVPEGVPGIPQTPLPTAPPPPASGHDWASSYHGLSSEPFSKEAAEILTAPIPFDDVEVKPDGIIYLPEIKYRRILNRAFGPGGWGLAPRGETIVTGKGVTREYALVVHGRLVSIARGEQQYFDASGIPTATEGCKSNALMRCCKDLGVASELWDPRYIRKFMKEKAKQVWCENVLTKKRKQLWYRKDDEVRYPWKETK